MYRFNPLSFAAILWLFSTQALFSQEQLGMRLERYAGIYSSSINPSSLSFNPNHWELSLFSAEAFVENNYAFLRNTSLQHALRNSSSIISVTDATRENPPGSKAILLDYFSGKHPMRAVVQTRVTGPGGSFRFGGKHVLGFSTSMRAELSSYKIPKILAYPTVSDLPRNQANRIPPAGLNGMVWGEIGLHYSQINTQGDLQTSWGVAPKILLGYEGFFTRAQTEFDYTQRLGDTVAFGSGNWDYALTLGNVDNTDATRLRRQGSGFGLDAGYSWAQPAEEGSSGYAWRLGVSVLDFGFVRFNKNAEQHHIEFDTMLTVSDANFPARDNAREVLGDVSQAFLGNSSASLQNRAFSIGLPTALSVQFDAQLAPDIYLGGLLVQRVPLWSHSVKRPNTLALAPRFERRWFSVSLPIVLSDWQSLRVGAAARLGWLYLGSDNIGSFFNKNKLSGADLYIGLKINAFSLNIDTGNKLTKESRPHRGRQKMRRIKCYQF